MVVCKWWGCRKISLKEGLATGPFPFPPGTIASPQAPQSPKWPIEGCQGWGCPPISGPFQGCIPTSLPWIGSPSQHQVRPPGRCTLTGKPRPCWSSETETFSQTFRTSPSSSSSFPLPPSVRANHPQPGFPDRDIAWVACLIYRIVGDDIPHGKDDQGNESCRARSLI